MKNLHRAYARQVKYTYTGLTQGLRKTYARYGDRTYTGLTHDLRKQDWL